MENIDYEEIQHQRLPNLYEVLIQKSSAPADLWSFYTFLSQFPYAINYLEFWIDLMNHLRLCRNLINDVRSSILKNNNNNDNFKLNYEDIINRFSSLNNNNNNILPNDNNMVEHASNIIENNSNNTIIETNDVNNNHNDEDEIEVDKNTDDESITSSILLNVLLNEGYLNPHDPARMSKFLQCDISSNDHRLSKLLQNWQKHNSSSHENSDNTNVSSQQFSNNTAQRFATMVDEMLQNTNKHNSTHNNVVVDDESNDAESSSSIHNEKDNIDKTNFITTKKLIKNANDIIDMYLISPNDSPKYLINIPNSIKLDVINKIKIDERFDPDVFLELQNIAYNFLENDCFPKFLKSIALHNIHDQISDWRFHAFKNSTFNPNKDNSNNYNRQLGEDEYDTMQLIDISNHISSSPFSNYTVLSRIFLGLLFLGIGFWIGYTLIFINYSRGIRVTTLPPFLIGCYYSICGIYRVDILYSIFGLTQDLMFQHKLNNKLIDKETRHNLKKLKKNIPSIFKILGGKKRLIKIEHPYIKRLLLKRGLWCATLVGISTAGLTVIFSVVPSWRA